ncbi:MAG: formate dehydrogenase subunit gamma [Alteromonadaceae bacterium]|nr:formate dehydrogenase subunit gamma [Alteromonadaceae bacterium]
MSAITSADIDKISDILQQNKKLPGALLPILHAIQDALGFVPDDAVPLIATALNQSRAEIHGVISFYHHFLTKKTGQHQISICRAESCQSMGSITLESKIKQRLKLDYHQTSADGQYSLAPVYCLGNCACSPAIRINDDIHGEMTMDKFESLLDSMVTYNLELK